MKTKKVQSAYTEFYKKYYADFIHIITFRLGNIDDAKDFSQDFWLFLFSNPGKCTICAKTKQSTHHHSDTHHRTTGVKSNK